MFRCMLMNHWDAPPPRGSLNLPEGRSADGRQIVSQLYIPLEAGHINQDMSCVKYIQVRVLSIGCFARIRIQQYQRELSHIEW